MLDDAPLPAQALPAADPTPTPTPGPSGADVAGFDGVLSSRIDRTGGHWFVHVERLVPTSAGGMRTAATMPAIDAGLAGGPDDAGPVVQLLARPGTADILVWVTTDAASSGWLWDGAAAAASLELPKDWP